MKRVIFSICGARGSPLLAPSVYSSSIALLHSDFPRLQLFVNGYNHESDVTEPSHWERGMLPCDTRPFHMADPVTERWGARKGCVCRCWWRTQGDRRDMEVTWLQQALLYFTAACLSEFSAITSQGHSASHCGPQLLVGRPGWGDYFRPRD